MFGKKITEMVHHIIKDYIIENTCTIDATAGNGYDTLFLAENAGKKGKVFSFDIQEVSIDNTRKLLDDNKLLNKVELINDSHHNIDKYVDDNISVAIFNLGYLPNGNKEIVTEAKTTIIALEKILKRLMYGGVIAITIYYKHEGGEEEKNILEKYFSELDAKKYQVVSINHNNRHSSPPIISFIYKKLRGSTN